MEKSLESNSFEKFKVKASLPIFQIILFKRRFLRKSSKPGHGNLVLIISTAQIKLSIKFFNFDIIGTTSLQVLT